MGTIMEKIIVLPVFLLIGCSSSPEACIRETLDISGSNAEELISVIEHYNSTNDSLKQRAAIFLVKNMCAHHSLRSIGLDSLTNILMKCDTIVAKDEINKIWKKLSQKDSVYRVYDAQSLNAKFLIEEIDKSFETWQQSSWKNDVDFEMYCKYILPYRLKDEPLKSGWRDSLRNKYGSLVRGISDMDIAYGKVYSAIYENMKAKTEMPYLTDPVIMQRIFRGGCLQRAIYVGSVMRALGLPVIIDGIDHWANVSTSGHYWVALVHKEGIATYSDKDSLAHIHNMIDASHYPLKRTIEKDYAYDTTFTKRVAKIFRLTYEKHEPVISDRYVPREIAKRFNSPFRKDVSCEYDLTDSLDFRFPNGISTGFLCTFITGKGWYPVCYSPITDNMARFRNIGDSVVYIGAYYDKTERLKCIGLPILIANGQKRNFLPDNENRHKISVTRKYPLTGNFISDWSMMRNARIEVSNDTTSSKGEIFAKIERTPVFHNIVKSGKHKCFRYLRYCNTESERIPHLAEVQFFDGDRIVKSKALGIDCEQVENCIDGDFFTAARGISNSYSILFDLGRAQKIDSILFVPKNDGNFVIPGDQYELLYYDDGWMSAGLKKSEDFKVTFENVPDGALLWLRDITKGKEERIFTYENGKQIWW